MPKMLLKFNAAVIKEIPFDKESLSVGRKPDNDIVIDNPAISGHHCRISVQGGTYFVEDLESTNGTFVNEKRIKKSGLHHNDVVGLAKHALVFIEDAPKEEAPLPVRPPEPAADATMMISPKKQAEMVAASASFSKSGEKERTAWLRVLKGAVGRYLTFTPSTPFAINEVVTVRVSSTLKSITSHNLDGDGDGQGGGDKVWTFTVSDH